jgi:hypothetical protein
MPAPTVGGATIGADSPRRLRFETADRGYDWASASSARGRRLAIGIDQQPSLCPDTGVYTADVEAGNAPVAKVDGAPAGHVVSLSESVMQTT